VIPHLPLQTCTIDGFRFEILEGDPSTTMPFHAHEQSHFVLVLSGSVKDSRKNRELELSPNSLVYLPGGESHATKSSPNCKIFQFVVQPSALDPIRNLGGQLAYPQEHHQGAPNWIANRMCAELRIDDDVRPLMLKGLGFELLAAIQRKPSSRLESVNRAWLTQAKEYLNAHFFESVSITELATIVSIHPAHLMRCFRREYRCTIGEYIRRLRIEHASRMLISGEDPLSAVSTSAGYSDQSHFIRAFKGATGMTPTAFQRANRNATLVP
jgi:AraC family transcriptional regulator